MNTIAHDQDTPANQRLLKARQCIYSDASRYQVLQLFLTVMLPVGGAVIAFLYPQTRPYVAIYGLIATALDVMWIDRAQRRTLRVASRITEQFDCEVLKLPWNVFVAGRREDEEVIDAAARRWSDAPSSIKEWYTGITPVAPYQQARLVCQRMNLQYDASLRRKYGMFLVAAVVVALIGLIVGAAAKDLKMLDVAAVATTVSPAMFWALREHYRQTDAATNNEALKGEAEKFLDIVRVGGCDDLECDRRSREFQDAIFQRRVANPLILPIVYKIMRPKFELQAKAAAEALLK